MSLRTAILVGLIALPTLAVKDPSFEKLTQYKGFSILFASLGAFVVPLWIPLLGDVVMVFTAVIPVGLAALWVAYGLFKASQSVIVMMLLCVVLGGGIFFLAEWLSLPVGLLSVFPTLFIVGACTFVQTPAKAWLVTVVVSALLFIAAVVAISVCTLVFPEYCVDEVFRHHHEALEHLLHLAYHALGLKPPALAKRLHASAAAKVGGEANWKAAFRAADELPSHLQSLAYGEGSPLLAEEPQQPSEQQQGTGSSASTTASSATYNRASVKTERSWHRVAVACQAGAQAQGGAMAEVVVMATHHKRIILPCSPLIPCARGQIDAPGLLALRHLALNTALHIIKIYNATQPLDHGTQHLLHQLLSEADWAHMRSSMLAALHELVSTFPMDYYPAAAPPDRQHLSAFQASVNALQAAWQAAIPARQQQQQQQAHCKQAPPQGCSSVQLGHAGSSSEYVGVPVLTQLEDVSAAAAAEAFKDPLVLEGSPAALVLARMNTVHLIKLLQELVGLLDQLYDAVQRVSERMLSCKCC